MEPKWTIVTRRKTSKASRQGQKTSLVQSATAKEVKEEMREEEMWREEEIKEEERLKRWRQEEEEEEAKRGEDSGEKEAKTLRRKREEAVERRLARCLTRDCTSQTGFTTDSGGV